MSKEKINFTEAFGEVEKINQWFQREDIDIDEALKKFKDGLEIVKSCQNRLKEVENKFHEIKKEFSLEESKEDESDGVL